MKINNLVIAAILLLYSLPSHAYLDPASGSALIASSGSIIFILLVFLTRIIQYIFGLVILLNSRINIFKNWDLVIHIEYSGYYSTFENMININKNKKILIICPKNTISLLNRKISSNRNIKICASNKLFNQSSIISMIKCEFFVTSTPGIGTRYFNKNKRINKTIYIAHAASDIHSYSLISFDHFDIIFCPNQTIKNNIELVLKRRGNKVIPIIYVVTLQYLIYIKNNIYYENVINTNKYLLIAPSWGKNSLAAVINDTILNSLLSLATKMSLEIVYRPHPQSISSNDVSYKYIDSFFKKSDIDYSIDLSDMPYTSLINSKILISDFSSIVYDYHFINMDPTSICYFNQDDNIDSMRESIFLDYESLEHLSYSQGTIMCDNYMSFLTAIDNFNPLLSYGKIDVDELFIHKNSDYLLDINNLKCTISA